MCGDRNRNQNNIHIGTSGWAYKHWIGDFYSSNLAQGEFLKWYSSHFQTVEINNTFYRLPEDAYLNEWYKETPPNFLFAVKASKYITHMKKLKPPFDPVSLFLNRVERLADKLGPILFQLPPRWRADKNRLKEFLVCLPAKFRYAFEFRDPSWFTEDIFSILKEHNSALCIYDLVGKTSPQVITSTTFTYIRLHGSVGNYAGSYPDHVLSDWARRIKHWWESGLDVFIYFNNDHQGHAVRNAGTLKKFINESAHSDKSLQMR
jgi:uncharacterized protein YecE (DUF72 family)